MNEQALLHIPDSKYCFAVDEHHLVLRLRVDKNDPVEKVEVIYESKYLFHEQQKNLLMEGKYEDALFVYYEIMLEVKDVRFAYIFRIWENEKGFYFSEDGLSSTYNFQLGYFNFFQLPYINAIDIHREVSWMRKAVFYQIFVDRFCKGNEKKDKRYITMEWGELPKTKGFAGGDLQGIIKKLDHIRELGCNTLYLTPIFSSVSNHKYDISDYHAIDEQFGTNADLQRLVKEAHRHGMRIVLDAVFNHCSEKLPQFQDVLKRGNKSPYFDWFLIDGEKPVLTKCNYEVFSFCEYMPKLNTSNAEVQKFLINIATCWIKKYDIDGWRLDVSDEVSHDFWRNFRKHVKQVKEDCIIIGENWHDANSFLYGEQYDGIMNYAFSKACLDFYSFETYGAREFAWKLNQLLMRNTWQVNHMMLNLLDSHDTDRFYTSVSKSKEKLLSAVAVMCMYCGAPCIYYGTEIPLEGGYDPDNRRCFNWEIEDWDLEYQQKLKELLRLRQMDEIQNGDIAITQVRELLQIIRRREDKRIFLYVNQTGKPVRLAEAGDVIACNRYSDGTLEHNGYVVWSMDEKNCREEKG